MLFSLTFLFLTGIRLLKAATIRGNELTGIGKTPVNRVRFPKTQLVYIVSCSFLMISLILIDLKLTVDGKKSCTISETCEIPRQKK